MVDAGSKLTYENNETTFHGHPWGQDPDRAQMKAFLTIAGSKTFLEAQMYLNPHKDEANKRKAEACKHTQMIQMLNTDEKQITSAMLIGLLVPFAPVLKFNVS